MDKVTVKELREQAKDLGLKDFWKLRKEELLNFFKVHRRARTARRADHAPRTLLDTNIPQTLPPPTDKISKVKKAVQWGRKKVNDWGEWWVNAPTEEPKVNSALTSFKNRINELYKQTKSFSLQKEKSALNSFANMCIDGVDGYIPMSFLSAVRTEVTNLLLDSKQTKVKMVLYCKMERTDLSTGETAETTAPFASRIHLYSMMEERIL